MDLLATTAEARAGQRHAARTAERWRAHWPAPYSVFVGSVVLATTLVIFAPIVIMFVRTLFPDGALNVQALRETSRGRGFPRRSSTAPLSSSSST